MATAYAIWHGPAGLQAIAGRIHALANRLASGLESRRRSVLGASRFDAVMVVGEGKAATIFGVAGEKIRLGSAAVMFLDGDHVSVLIAFDERSSRPDADLDAIAALLTTPRLAFPPSAPCQVSRAASSSLTQPVFHENKSETEMMRFLRRLADKDLALDRAMIPLGSCTMKLNAAAEMMPVSWPWRSLTVPVLRCIRA